MMSHNDLLSDRKYSEILRLDEKERAARDAAYFKRYTLSTEEYHQKWKPIRDTIFDPNAKYFPEMLFQQGFQFIYGPPQTKTITRYQLSRLKKCMRALNEKEFVLIENAAYGLDFLVKNDQYNPYMFKYSASIPYTKLIDGGIKVGWEIDCCAGINDYVIFSESGKWGVYSPADDGIEDTVLFIIAFRKEVEPLFAEVFKNLTTKREKKYIREECLPFAPAYQPYDKYLR